MSTETDALHAAEAALEQAKAAIVAAEHAHDVPAPVAPSAEIPLGPTVVG